MDLIFKCPQCEQELAVDAAAAGSEIECPTCQQVIVVPANEVPPEPSVEPPGEVEAPAEVPEGTTPAPAGAAQPHAVPPADHHHHGPHKDLSAQALNPLASSAAAKIERHFAVPVHDGPAEVLIKKPVKALEAAAKQKELKIMARTFRHTDCIEVGKDRYDEFVSEFLSKVGHEKIVSVTPITYTYIDMGTQKMLTSYGLTVIYRS